MNSRERFERALKGMEVDRVPIGYLFFGAGNYVLKKLGASFKDVYYSGSGIAKAQPKALELFSHDNVATPWGCLTVEAEALGSRVIIKENDYPRVVGDLITEKEELEKISVPEPEKNPMMRQVLESVEVMSKEVGDKAAVLGMVGSPTLVASTLRGFENFCLDMFRDNQFLNELLEMVTECCASFATAMIGRGAHGIIIENSCAGEDMISPKQCDTFVMPYNKKLIRAINSAGGYAVVYNSSDSPFIDKELASGAQALSFYRGNKRSILERHGWDCDEYHLKIGACRTRFCISDFPSTT